MSVLFTRRGGELINLNNDFASNDWEQIIKACQSNSVPDSWVVGNNKSMVINNKVYQIDIIGKNHDVYSDGTGTAPLTFQMHDAYETKYSMHTTDTNRGSWAECNLRSTTVPMIRSLMPTEIQSALRKVSKLTSEGSTSGVIVTTADDLFLLSEIETLGTIVNSKVGEGVQYEYYKQGNSVVKNILNNEVICWVRSPKNTNSGLYCCINSIGDSRTYSPTSSAGVAFAFCF